MVDGNIIQVKIDYWKKINLSKDKILFEERVSWIPFVFGAIMISMCGGIINFFELLFPWIQILIIVTTFFLSKSYRKNITITIDGIFEKQVYFLGIGVLKSKVKSKKSIFYVKLFTMGDAAGMPNGRIGYLFGLIKANDKVGIFRLYDRTKVLQIIKFLKENNYVVKGWEWDY